MSVRHVLSIADLGTETLSRLVDDAVAIARGEWKEHRPLRDKVVGIYFPVTSTRTRTAFTIGAMKLGASTIAYGPKDLQIVTGETIQDTARVLANYMEVLVIRTNGPIEELHQLSEQGRMSIVNAMTENEHPTQALCDLAALKEALGRLQGIRMLYLGEGNNTASALALAFGSLPDMHLTIVTPEGYGLSPELIAQAQALADANGSSVEQHHDMEALPKDVDAVYTARWLTMGVKKDDASWVNKFRPYTITPEVMARVSKEGTIFLHDLPAMRGYEVVDEVLDGPQSIAFRQAFHKMTSAMAALNWCAGEP